MRKLAVRQTGYTALEVLVVIISVGILAALVVWFRN